MQGLPGHRVDEIARLKVRADPAVEAVILPEEKAPRFWTQQPRHVLQQAIDDIGAEAGAAEVRGIRGLSRLTRLALILGDESGMAREIQPFFTFHPTPNAGIASLEV